jgi:hypothetical protein
MSAATDRSLIAAWMRAVENDWPDMLRQLARWQNGCMGFPEADWVTSWARECYAVEGPPCRVRPWLISLARETLHDWEVNPERRGRSWKGLEDRERRRPPAFHNLTGFRFQAKRLPPIHAPNAEAQLDKHAQEVMHTFGMANYFQAYDYALRQHPELYEQTLDTVSIDAYLTSYPTKRVEVRAWQKRMLAPGGPIARLKAEITAFENGPLGSIAEGIEWLGLAPSAISGRVMTAFVLCQHAGLKRKEAARRVGFKSAHHLNQEFRGLARRLGFQPRDDRRRSYASGPETEL